MSTPSYFTGKAIEILNQTLGGPEFYSDGHVGTVALALRGVARDQRHACAEAVNEAAETMGGHPRPEAVERYHAAVINARISPAAPGRLAP